MEPEATPFRARAMRALLIGVVLQTLFVFFFVFPGHEPEPNGLQIAVVGSDAAAAGFTQAVQRRGDFAVERASSPAAARRLIEDREVYGAYVLGAGGAVNRVLLARAASLPASQVVEGVGQAAGSFAVTDVKPLPAGDPRGVSLGLLVLPIVITSILAALAAVNLIPEARAAQRLGLSAAAGILGGLIAVLIVNVWLDALGGPWLAEAAVIALAVVAIALTSAGIIRLLGPAATALPFLIFLMIGNPASGVSSAPELLPTPWKEVGQFLPPGALGTGLRDTAYFDGAAIMLPLAVLVAWAALGYALVVMSDRRQEPAPSSAA